MSNSVATGEVIVESAIASYNCWKEQPRYPRILRYVEGWYLPLHMLYIAAWALCGAAVFVAVEGVAFVDALFVSVSAVTCTGLSSIDVSHWSGGSTVVRHVLMVAGGAVFTSSFQPLIRYAAVRCALCDSSNHVEGEGTTLLQQHGGGYLEAWDEDALHTVADASLVAFVTPLAYFVTVQGTLVAILAVGNSSGISLEVATQRVVANFHSCAFSSLVGYSHDPVAVAVLGWSCGLGYTMCPFLMRWFVALEEKICAFLRPSSSRTQRSFGLLLESTISSSMFHCYLSTSADCLYYLVTFVCITGIQFLPYLWQQWSGDGVLGDISREGEKVNVAWSQSILSRFSGGLLIDTTRLSNAHLAIILFAMYLPAMPKAMKNCNVLRDKFLVSQSDSSDAVRTVWRLVTSRFLWLFAVGHLFH